MISCFLVFCSVTSKYSMGYSSNSSGLIVIFEVPFRNATTIFLVCGRGVQTTPCEQNEKRHPFGCLFVLVAGAGFEPHDLRVMSPTSYQAALPRDIKLKWCRRTGSNRHGDLSPRDFKSRVSANSTTPACRQRGIPPHLP